MERTKIIKDFLHNDPVGMKTFVSDVNQKIIKSFWYNETEGLAEVLEQSAQIREVVQIKSDIKRERDYYFGFVWGIENMARQILYHREDYSEIETAVQKYKNLHRILSYLKVKETARHQELADFLDISASGLSNFFSNNNIERLKIISVQRIGRATLYSLTDRGLKYIQLAEAQQSAEIDNLKHFLIDLIKGLHAEISVDLLLDYTGQYLLIDEEKKTETAGFLKKELNEYLKIYKQVEMTKKAYQPQEGKETKELKEHDSREDRPKPYLAYSRDKVLPFDRLAG